ncbi:MAG: Asp-tRNA(Asn)/Glu-tRNA(Gln) amidotransferase subunit GatA [Candidatus Magnetoovum sp. WYHC-5]|nr:Asp-tRNA(Asn)/Glu-tRNA(Gln) amidotransferase subunit GatA [Candidatus Magnetoovum sp. WYHC-5]
MKLSHMNAHELKALLATKEVSCKEIMSSIFDEIDKREYDVAAYIHIRDKKELFTEAEKIDNRRLKADNIGILDGLPISIKDNICTKAIPTTCASKMLENFVPPYDATIIKKIRQADGIIIGKTNLDEFAMGSSTEHSAFKITKNPHNTDYVPGGTSGGACASVAANECIMAIGSDTGGSIRQPASFCGVTGLKPTYGRVSRFGLVAYGSSLDQIGTVTKNVKDTALLLQVIAGVDSLDATSVDESVPNYCDLLSLNGKLTVGIPKEFFAEGLDHEVENAVKNCISLLEKDGHNVIEISIPHTPYAVPAYYITACSEASSNLARYDGVKYGYRATDTKNLMDMYLKTRGSGFGAEVKRRIMLGTYTLSAGYYDAFYLKAAKVRTLIAQDFAKAFELCDIIISPVAPTAAYKIGEKADDPLAMYLGDIYSVIANLTGLPAISVPCGWTTSRLPIGVQLTTRALNEPLLLSAAYRLEQLLATVA